MTNLQLWLAVGIPILANAAFLVFFAFILLSKRIDDLRADIHEIRRNAARNLKP